MEELKRLRKEKLLNDKITREPQQLDIVHQVVNMITQKMSECKQRLIDTYMEHGTFRPTRDFVIQQCHGIVSPALDDEYIKPLQTEWGRKGVMLYTCPKDDEYAVCFSISPSAFGFDPGQDCFKDVGCKKRF